jgi:replicative DNA helicase
VSDTEVVIPHDVVNEQVILAAAVADWDGEAGKLLDRLQPDTFLHEDHRAAWAALQEMRRRKLQYDPATLKQYLTKADPGYLQKLVSMRPDAPANLGHHLDGLLWDRKRANAVQGPIAALLEAVRNPSEEPERVRALARHVAEAFQGEAGRGRFLADGNEVVRSQMDEVRRRIAGHATYTYGIKGLDYDLETKERRVLPGPAPGQVTVFTAISGGGKTTAAGRVTLGIAKQRRKVLYGAYEMGPGMTLELLACMSLGWSRSKLLKGMTQNPEAKGEKMSTLETLQIEERMHAIHPWVSFMRNPFRQRGGQKASNQRNLDTIQEHIVDSGCQVFVADLWKRCLVDARPEAEEDALYQQQAMAEETRTHHILLQQQRLKDIEARPDKRPTREGIKGSGAWTEIADTILGFHLPGMWKNIANDKMEIFVLKQRHGEWPIGAEFDWSGEYGSITGGVSVEYKHTVEGGQGLFDEGSFKAPKLGGTSDSRKRK